MKLSINVYLLLLFFLLPFVSDAQILNRIKRAAEQGVGNAVERRVAKEVENATQRQLEKAFGQLYGGDSDDPNVGIDMSKIMKGINMNVKTEDSYAFQGIAEMEITGTDEKGKAMDPVMMKTFLNEGKEYSGMEVSAADQKKKKDNLEKTVMIFDSKNNASIILVENEGEKSSMAFGLDYAIDEKILENDSLKAEDIQFEKTGRTKTIAGYVCEEYKAESEEYVASYWATKESVTGFGSFWGKNSPFLTKKMKNSRKDYFEKLPEGDILEINSQSKKDKSTFDMTVKSLDTSTSTDFVMADYPNMMKGETANN